jgi:hypothetical protein
MDEALKKIIQDYKYKDISLDEMYKKLLPYSGTYSHFPQYIKDSISEILLSYKWKNKSFNDTINEIDILLWQTGPKKNDSGGYYIGQLLEKAIQDLKDLIAKQGLP